MRRTNSRSPLIAVALVLALVATPALANFPTAASDNTTFSIGQAIIWVEPAFAHLVSSTPGWNLPTPGHWTSPFMYDFNTVIGHSKAHTDGVGVDITGASVGSAGTSVKDAHFNAGPHPGEGPANQDEIHTEIYRLNLEEPLGCNMGFSIIAGTGMGVSPPSVGEV